uniref:Transposase putative n=1 Tax=Albugo laibachii Nc14 TaxID=890382 RepID=F0WJZ6_9STRA|nr:transposase putative [Albugo laibachii Nc14]|eukprot:CCA21598.1 transposase putative [Albugo laibachii Nc14]
MDDDLMTVPVPTLRAEPAPVTDADADASSTYADTHRPHNASDAAALNHSVDSSFALHASDEDDSHYRLSNHVAIATDDFPIVSHSDDTMRHDTDTPSFTAMENTTSIHENGEACNSNRTRRQRRSSKSCSKKDAAMMLPSYIWNYFVKDSTGKYVICTLCTDQSTRFAYSGGTSTMNRHLRKKHHKFAPGKSAADYEKSKSSSNYRRYSPNQATNGLGYNTIMDAATLNGVSLNELQTQRQFVDMRRRGNIVSGTSYSKRRKLYPGLVFLDTTDSTTNGLTSLTTDFDPTGFVNLAANGSLGTPFSSALDFCPDLDASTATNSGFMSASSQAMSPSTTLNSNATANSGLYQPSMIDYTALVHGSYALRNRVHQSLSTQKLLAHRVLKYLIAQYEPLHLSLRMQSELHQLLFGTEQFLPSTPFPTEEALKVALANLYCSQRELLKEFLVTIDHLSLSLNNWTSKYGQNILTVTAHWISSDFRRRDCILEVYILPLGEHINTVALLHDVMYKWDIPASKLVGLTMSQDAKVGLEDDPMPQTALHQEFPMLYVVNCFTQVLDTAMSEGLSKCEELIRRCRNYVSYFIQNPSEYQIFLTLKDSSAQSEASTSEACEQSEEDPAIKTESSESVPPSSRNMHPSTLPISVICDYDGRWNTTVEMIVRIVELESCLILYKRKLEEDGNPSRRPMQLRFACCEITNDEWYDLKELARLLEPLGDVAHLARQRTDYYPGLSIMYPIWHSIKEHLRDATLWITTPLAAVVANTIASCFERVEPCAMSSSTRSSYLACLLDPRFKSLPFLNASEKERLIEELRALQLEMIGEERKTQRENTHTEADHNASKADTKLATPSDRNTSANGGISLLQQYHKDNEQLTDDRKALHDHLTQYLDSPCLPASDDPDNDPLEWWNRYQRLYPLLAKSARHYLCLPAVSIPFDEVFTNVGQLMREKKTRLDIEVAAQMLFSRSVSNIPEMDRLNLSG